MLELVQALDAAVVAAEVVVADVDVAVVVVAAVGFVAAEDDAGRELVAVPLPIDAEVVVVLAPVGAPDVADVVVVAALLLRHVGVDNKRRFVYLAGSTVRLIQ